MVGWQTLLADLSLILFMVTAAAMAAKNPAPRPHVHDRPASALPALPTRGEPLAVWRDGGPQTLRDWLAGQQPDARQRLTVTAYYPDGDAARALAAAQALLDEAGPLGRAARVIVAPVAMPRDAQLLASLAYDRLPGPEKQDHPPPGMARALRSGSDHLPGRNPS